MDPLRTSRGRIRYLPGDAVSGREVVHEVDHRWLRAYTTAVGDLRPRFFDMRHEAGLVAHPVFPACLEWPLFTGGVAGLEIDGETLNRGLHVGQRLRWHRPISPGDRLTTRSRLLNVQQKRQHVYVRVGLETLDSAGRPVVSTVMDVLYRDTEIVGEPVTEEHAVSDIPPIEPGQLTADKRISTFEVDRTNAIVYTECARIWNPVHTEDPAAEVVGLPAPVLHGTETLARAVSAVLDYLAPRGELDVSTVSCRFTGMVLPFSTLEVLVSDYLERPGRDILAFEVHGPEGSAVISDGFIEFGGCR